MEIGVPIYDFSCNNPECSKNDQAVERLVKSSDSIPQCEECEHDMVKLPLSYKHFGWHANMSSLRFHFNWLD